MPKTNLCKTEILAPSNTPTFELLKLVVGQVTTKFVVGGEYFLKEKYGKKITSSKKVRDHYKAYGQLFIAVYELVKESSMHDRVMPGLPYNSPSKWFEECLLDLAKLEVKSLRVNEGNCFNWSFLKKELKSYYRDGCFDFRKLSLDNPFAKKDLTALALLVEYAVVVSEENYKFQQDYWNPFVRAVCEVSSITNKRKGVESFTVSPSGEVTSKNHKVVRYLPFLDEKMLLKLCI